MDKGRVSKFFKVYINNNTQKVFLDDVSLIYKRSIKKTPPLTPYYQSSNSPMHPGQEVASI